MAEMRTLLWELRPESIIQTQLSGLLTQISYAIRARQEAEISVTIRAENEYLLPADAQVAFYRIAQESVHNVLKHGQANSISILLRQTPQYTALIVVDDGQGFASNGEGGGFGLRNMQERAASISAQFGIKSQIGKGTRMRLLWITPPPDTHPLETKNPVATPEA
jgi:signal transduction histidine kinase